MPTYKWVALLVLVASVGWFGIWQWLIRRAYARFFDPAIEQAQHALAAFAQQSGGSFVPSRWRWADISPWLNNHLRARSHNESRAKAYRGDGGVELWCEGLPMRVSWLIVALRDGFAFVPRVRVDLPPDVSFQGLHGASSNLFDNPWHLLAKNILDVSEKRPSFPLTAPEQQAFDALRTRACRIFMRASVPGHPITGRMPPSYALYLEVWGDPHRGESSPVALERNTTAWREDFTPEDLATLADLTGKFASLAVPLSGAATTT
jgi:hypothetical protein